MGIIREARLASREAIDGLGNDLSSELVHSSHGIITRNEAERASLQEEINDLRKSLSHALSGDANMIRRENEALRIALNSVPEFRLLKVIQKNRRSTYAQLMECTGFSKAKLRKLAKELGTDNQFAQQLSVQNILETSILATLIADQQL